MSDLASPEAESGAEATAEKKPFAALLTSEFVNVYVGAKRKQYCIHKKLLCSQSLHFEQAVEKADGTSLYLDDVHVEAFERFVEWMYRGAAQSIQATGKWFGDWGHGELYILAGKWEMEDLQNHAMDCLVGWCREYNGLPDVEAIRTIFQSTDRSSRLRRFVVCQTVHFIGTPDWTNEAEGYCQELVNIGGEFGMDVMKLMRGSLKRNIKDPIHQRNCDFHSHASGKRCDGRR